MPNLCNVGALFRRTYLFAIISSKIAQTSGIPSSINLFAPLMLYDNSFSSNFDMTNGLKSSNAMCLGIPHWSKFNLGPTTITLLPE